ncbi:MAG: tRNA pseudouridine(55) synthase TruB [Candidatus Enteromonas sp.]|nr:tRNA pseudouridine(55) synthase TruB [bacterium]MDY6100946.1 tRNA pseudouridine(55) synthase TruB [Candidatus Enteromonas sp.]
MMQGILLVDKEAGMTSRKVDNLLQKRFLTKKVGHLGTLDPFATGLLIVAVGKATKCLPFLDSSSKTYEAELLLGSKTSTGDLEGDEILRKDPRIHEKQEIEETLSSFLGESTQIPPMSSAIKVDGVALYKLAHKGQEIERKPRKIVISSIRLLSQEGPRIRFEAEVSSGTYLRTLGEDIAERLGEVGHLVSLRRTKIGSVDVRKAKRIAEVSEGDLLSPLPFITLPKIEATEKQSEAVKNGKAMILDSHESEVCLFFQEEALAVYAKGEDGLYRSKRGLF